MAGGNWHQNMNYISFKTNRKCHTDYMGLDRNYLQKYGFSLHLIIIILHFRVADMSN